MKKVTKYKNLFIIKFNCLEKIEADDYVLKDVEFSEKEGIDFLNITISLQKKGERKRIKMITCMSGKFDKEMLRKAANDFVLTDYLYLKNRACSAACRNAAKKMIEPLYAMLIKFYETRVQRDGL